MRRQFGGVLRDADGLPARLTSSPGSYSSYRRRLRSGGPIAPIPLSTTRECEVS